jgi:hypothetical protein
MQAQPDETDLGRASTQFKSGQRFFIWFAVDLMKTWKGKLVYSCDIYDVTSGSPLFVRNGCNGAVAIDPTDRLDLKHTPVFDLTMRAPPGRPVRLLLRGHVTMESETGFSATRTTIRQSGETQERSTLITISP